MTLKDYEALATALAGVRPVEVECADMYMWVSCVSQVALVLQEDNPAFNRARFVEACQG